MHIQVSLLSPSKWCLQNWLLEIMLQFLKYCLNSAVTIYVVCCIFIGFL